jgi:LacI family transcriptional regulator
MRARQLGFTVQISYLRRQNLLNNDTENLFGDSKGVLMFTTEATYSDLKLLEDIKVPIVLIDNTYETLHFDSIMIGNMQGSFSATKYLIDNGHTNIGFIGAPPGISSFDERKEGFLKAVSLDVRTEKSRDNIITVSPESFTDLYGDLRRQLLMLREMPSAFVLRHDLIANICYQALNDLGYSIPGDISIVGFDNNPICELITPKLTTVDFSKQNVGVLAVNRLNEIINGNRTENVRIDILPRLLLRDSVKSIL